MKAINSVQIWHVALVMLEGVWDQDHADQDQTCGDRDQDQGGRDQDQDQDQDQHGRDQDQDFNKSGLDRSRDQDQVSRPTSLERTRIRQSDFAL